MYVWLKKTVTWYIVRDKRGIIMQEQKMCTLSLHYFNLENVRRLF